MLTHQFSIHGKFTESFPVPASPQAPNAEALFLDLLCGKVEREPSVAYQCHLAGGKHTCIEKDIEIVPMEKIVTVLPEDTFGIRRILSDYAIETSFHRLSDSSTRVEISHYFSRRKL